MRGAIPPLPNTSSWRGVELKHRDNFIFTLLLFTDWMSGVLGFDSRRGLINFLFTTASRPALGLTQLPIEWVPGVLSLGVKRPGREADHSPPSSAEAKEWVELYLHSTDTSSWRGVELKHRDNFTFNLLLLEISYVDRVPDDGGTQSLRNVGFLLRSCATDPSSKTSVHSVAAKT
jgi:hypothetical protein